MGAGASLIGSKHAVADAPWMQRWHEVQDRTNVVQRLLQQFYAVADAQAIGPVRRTVEQHVVKRVHRWMQEADGKSKIFFVKSISTTAIVDAFDIALQDVRSLQIRKRQYQVYNCGPELLNVPTLLKEQRPLELVDASVLQFLLETCRWTLWQPPTSFRMKTDQVFDLQVHVAVRDQGFLTKEIRIVKIKVGRKWVGPHHHDAMEFAAKSTWLHRTDYETDEHVKTAESVFFQTIKTAWQEYVDELARLPKEDLRGSEETGDGFPYDAQERQSSLRIKYLVETSIEHILKEQGTMFRSCYLYEQWRMQQEDCERHQLSSEQMFAGPLVQAHVDLLAEYYENYAMEKEDLNVFS